MAIYISSLTKNVVSDYVIGTGVLLPVNLGFIPKHLELKVSESSVHAYWNDSFVYSHCPTGVCAVEYCAELRTGEIVIGVHTPHIGTTDTQIATDRCVTQHDGAGDVRVETAAVAAGTAFAGAADDITANLWGCYKVACATGGAISITPCVTSGPMAHVSEAAAIADVGVTPANEAVLGYVTVKATLGAIFNATTDALAGGATATPAEITHYYPGYGIMANGILPRGRAAGDTYMGFSIGTDANLNVALSRIDYKAYRS